MAYRGQSVHVACAFSIIEICAVLYRRFLRYDPRDPARPDRDYLILSKGHGVMAMYACFYEIGWLRDANLDDYFKQNLAYQTAFNLLPYGIAEPPAPGYDFVRDLIEGEMAAIMDGSDVESTLSLANGEANLILDDQLSAIE